MIIKKENIKTISIYCGVSLLVIIAIVGIYNYFRNVDFTDGTITYDIYYIDKTSQKLDIEERVVNYVDDDSTMFNTVVDEFASGPSSTNTKLILP